MPSRLVLASGSPQRRAILDGLGVDFEVAVPGVEELSEGEPRALVRENALRKARAVAAVNGLEKPVLGVDTVVALGRSALRKARGCGSGRARCLRELSGRTHEVHSGLALIDADGEQTREALTRVRFRRLSEGDLEWYVAGGEWRERAGGYAIQGPRRGARGGNRGRLLERGGPARLDADHARAVPDRPDG